MDDLEPFPTLGRLLLFAARAVWWVMRRATLNVAELGPAWPVAYWLAVYLSWTVGHEGSRRVRLVRRGNDFFEFDPERRGAAWAGRVATVLRLQIMLDAWGAAGRLIVGYGSCFALIVVGVVWDWLLVAGATVLLAGAVRLRMASGPRWFDEP